MNVNRGTVYLSFVLLSLCWPWQGHAECRKVAKETALTAEASTNVQLEDGFSTSASCKAGKVTLAGRELFATKFDGVYCKRCCGGDVSVETEIHVLRDIDRGEVRCVRWGQLGENDDITRAHWFESDPQRGWRRYGWSHYCGPNTL